MPTNSLSFNDTSVAFSGKTNTELKKEFQLFRLMNNAVLVNIGSKATQLAFKLNFPIQGIVKKTVYAQFCGGETLEETSPVIDHLAQFKIGAILDYGVEGKETEADFEATQIELIKTIKYAKSKKNIPFLSCKITGLTTMHLLEKLNSKAQLTEKEQSEKEVLYTRMHTIAKAAADAGIGLFVDAEESWIQDAIDELVFILMRIYNKKTAIIYSTPQMYRHDRLEFCSKSLQDAIQNDYILGLKLVRGAYMIKERKRALEMNYASPIQKDKAASDRDYNAALNFCVANYGRISVCAATHNEESSILLADAMQHKNIAPNHPHFHFSQLYGMSDQITFNLAKSGFNVTKYLPFGPVKDVIPYLIRRAQENSSVSGQMSRELALLVKEIKRRGI